MRLLICILFLTACSKSVVIESSTAWSAAIGTSTEDAAVARSVDGIGSSSIPSDGQHVCWLVRKTTRAGTLRVYLAEHSIFGADRVSDAYTVADFGVVAGCAE